MRIAEHRNNPEFKEISESAERRSEINRKYEELTAIQELRKVEELPGAKPAQSFPKKRRSRVKVSALAAVALTAIVTVSVAAATAGPSITVASFTVEYTRMELALNIENAGGLSFTSELYVRGDTAATSPLPAGSSVVCAFDGLEPDTAYLLEIRSDDGETRFTREFSTPSPAQFFEKPQGYGRLYFRVDPAFVSGYVESWATLNGTDGVSLTAYTDEYGETYFDLTLITDGTYYFELSGQAPDGEFPVALFVKEMELKAPALQPAS